eukprot:COSAG01_NODE_4799_length_4735_cov_22.441976_2_plen_33_part_00
MAHDIILYYIIINMMISAGETRRVALLGLRAL